jgi:acetolactate synthase-1/2/3 large subunit
MDTARRRPGIDWIHTTVLQGQAVRDYVKWDAQPFGTKDVVDSFARAYRVATQEPQGPVYVCYDVAYQEDPLEGEYAIPDPAKTGPGTLFHPDPVALDTLADWLVAAERPVILAGYTARHKPSFQALVDLAEACGAVVVDQRERLNFPNKHPLSAAAAGVPDNADVLLSLDTLVLANTAQRVTRGGQPCKIAEINLRDIDISSWSMVFDQLVPVDLQIQADTAVSIPMLTQRVRQKTASDSAAQERIRNRREAARQASEESFRKWQEDAKKDWDASPLSTGRVMSEVWDVIKNEDWMLTANPMNGWAFRLWDFDNATRFGGQELGTATQIGASLGMALAYKGTGKLVVDIQPDGDLMYDAGALWVAAQMKLPMLVVMYNNRAYYNDWNHQINVAGERERPAENAWIGQAINDPPPDFAMMARSMGWYAEGPFERPDGLGDAIRRALAEVMAGRPALVDAVTQFR